MLKLPCLINFYNEVTKLMPNQILPQKEVKTLLHFKSDTSLYTLEQKDDTFPQRIRIGLHRVGYRADEIYSWLESRKVEHREVT